MENFNKIDSRLRFLCVKYNNITGRRHQLPLNIFHCMHHIPEYGSHWIYAYDSISRNFALSVLFHKETFVKISSLFNNAEIKKRGVHFLM